MIHLIIPRERIQKLMSSAGYDNHITQHEGKLVHGYKKDFHETHRWHAIEHGNSIEIHIDRTINGFHKLVSYKGKEEQERIRLLEIYKSLYTSQKRNSSSNQDEGILKMKIKKKGEFAPNLMELQRNHKTEPPALLEFVSKMEGIVIDK